MKLCEKLKTNMARLEVIPTIIKNEQKKHNQNLRMNEIDIEMKPNSFYFAIKKFNLEIKNLDELVNYLVAENMHKLK